MLFNFYIYLFNNHAHIVQESLFIPFDARSDF